MNKLFSGLKQEVRIEVLKSNHRTCSATLTIALHFDTAIFSLVKYYCDHKNSSVVHDGTKPMDVGNLEESTSYSRTSFKRGPRGTLTHREMRLRTNSFFTFQMCF